MSAFIAATTATLIAGDPSNPTTNYGSLTSLQHREKVESYVSLARQDQRANIVCGGRRPIHLINDPLLSEGAFYEPTIITGLPHDHRVATEEIFGPVVTGIFILF